MEKFKSDISQKEYSNSEKVNANIVSDVILDLIKKDYPDFNSSSKLSVSELNMYRQKFIECSLLNEVGELNTLEKAVLNAIKDNETLTSKIDDEVIELTIGQRLSDQVAAFGGSWKFIITFLSMMTIWILMNVIFLVNKFDPFPFILLNLILSCIAALQAPVIMMSQNRKEEKDRERAKKDYMINLKSELEIRMLHEKIDHLILHQQHELIEIQQIQIEMMSDILKKLDKN